MKTAIPIVKMSGAGNDFVVLGAAEAALVADVLAAWTRRVCRRGLSVGADGVLVVTPSTADRVRVRFLNPDGSEAFCGNGSRCAARFAVLRGLARSPLVLETAIGDVPAAVSEDAVTLTVLRPEDHGPRTLEGEGFRIEGRFVMAGVPHFIAFHDDLERAPLDRLGPWARRHPSFGAGGANVDLVAWNTGEAGGTLGIRTWERGVEGETLSCGSGALAAALVACEQTGRNHVRVVPASRIPLEIGIGAPGDPMRATLRGDARVVLEGVVPPEAIEGFEPK
jgi:diaminopimelate epimerase